MNNTNSSQSTDPRLLRLDPTDNVAVATTTIEAGESVTIDGRPVTLPDRVPTGHKLALRPIVAGEKVRKYGSPIGSATCDVQPGDHVHTQNLKSDYLPTSTLDGSNPYLNENSRQCLQCNLNAFSPLLDGTTDWPAVIRALDKVGYRDYLTFEYFNPFPHWPESLIYQTSHALDRMPGRKG